MLYSTTPENKITKNGCVNPNFSLEARTRYRQYRG